MKTDNSKPDYFDVETKRPPVYTLTKIDRIIRRHKYIILGAPFIGITSCFVYLQNTPPIFESSTQILFHSDDQTFVESQTNVIKSKAIITQAIRKLKITDLQTSPAQTKFKALNVYTPKLSEQSLEIIDSGLSSLSNKIAHNLTARRLPNSYIIQIKYRDHSPHRTANIVNAISHEYLKTLASGTPLAPETEKTDLTDLLHRQVINAREELTVFEKNGGRAQPATFIAAISRAKEKEYEQALLSFAEAKAALYPFLDEEGNLTFNAKAPAILHSALLRELSYKFDELTKERDLLSKRYGHKHPKMISLSSAISLVHEQVKREEQNIMHRIYNEYKAAKNTVETFEKPNNIKAIEKQQKPRQEQLIMLQNRLTSAQALFDTYVQNQNIKTPQQITKPEATWIAQGLTPHKPIHPNKRKILGLATLFSVFIGFALALLLEKLRPTFLSGRELEEITHRPCYALIPQANADTIGTKRKENIINDVLQNPESTIADAVRSLRLTLKLREKDKDKNKVITITSSYAGEGKTTLALWMARLAAKAGERVILIDANLRAPDIHKIMQQNNSASLVEYITKQRKMEDIINTNDPSGTHMIFSRTCPGNAIDYLSSERMEQLIRSLRKAYDLIIIDSPASMSAPDAQALAKLSDTILYTVHWNKTRREIIHSGISQFNNAEKPRVATVLTQINLKKHIEYGFGHSFFDYESDKDYAPA